MFNRPLRDRPFKRLLLGRRIRRVAQGKLRSGQLSADEYDQICAKTMDLKSLQAICDHIENDDDQLYGDVDWQGWWRWMVDNWPSILRFIMTLAPLLLDEPPQRGGFRPNVGYDTVNPRKKRLGIKSYQNDLEYLEDMNETLDELDV